MKIQYGSSSNLYPKQPIIISIANKRKIFPFKIDAIHLTRNKVNKNHRGGFVLTAPNFIKYEICEKGEIRVLLRMQYTTIDNNEYKNASDSSLPPP